MGSWDTSGSWLTQSCSHFFQTYLPIWRLWLFAYFQKANWPNLFSVSKSGRFFSLGVILSHHRNITRRNICTAKHYQIKLSKIYTRSFLSASQTYWRVLALIVMGWVKGLWYGKRALVVNMGWGKGLRCGKGLWYGKRAPVVNMGWGKGLWCGQESNCHNIPLLCIPLYTALDDLLHGGNIIM